MAVGGPFDPEAFSIVNISMVSMETGLVAPSTVTLIPPIHADTFEAISRVYPWIFINIGTVIMSFYKRETNFEILSFFLYTSISLKLKWDLISDVW